MIDPVSAEGRRTPPITPQLALRVAILGGIGFVLFAIVFFRLWYLQVLSGDQYLQQARDNRVREVRVQAPRGKVLDRNGDPIVENRAANVVQVDPESLPEAERDAASDWGHKMAARARKPDGQKGPLIPVPDPPAALAARFKTLAGVLEMSPKTIQERVIRSLWLLPYANVTIKVDVDVPQRNYLVEQPERFPGVSVEHRYLRRYPQGSLAAQMVGSVGQIDEQQLKLDRFKGVTPGTVVGQGGIESAYDQYLRGVDGSTKITIDALGRPKSTTAGRDPTPGRSVRTTLHTGVQATGEKYLRQAIEQGPGTAGGFVAMDPRNGDILGLGSYPTYKPSILSRPFSQAVADRLYSDKYGAPLVNRAISGAYPTGSTFKPITALAAMSSGVVTPSEVIDDNGCIEIGTNKQKFCNAGSDPLGQVDMTSALSKSSDVYFYTMGQRLNDLAGQPLQKWARRMGLGNRTGIDMPGEFPGTIPDRAWRDALNAEEATCRKKKKRPCGIADGTNRSWTTGDEVNLSVGQGDVQATPLQMAVAYAALANGNRRVRPHLGAAVEDSGGRLLQRIEPGTATAVKFDPLARETILDGLHQATLDGTSADVWKGWDQKRYPVFGKTGTAERKPHLDQSWYVCFINDPARPIVVAVTVEDGLFGAETAAPIARTIAAQWYDQPIEYVPGKSHTH